LRAEREKARAARATKKEEDSSEETITPAAIQYTEQEKIIQMLNRFHKR